MQPGNEPAHLQAPDYRRQEAAVGGNRRQITIDLCRKLNPKRPIEIQAERFRLRLEKLFDFVERAGPQRVDKALDRLGRSRIDRIDVDPE
jgi:hypothetical protein